MQKIGPYEIAGLLATGGMAEILLGRRRGPSGFERVVVIKRILPTLARDMTYVSMFVDEARIAARIQHPNVVQVFDLVIEDELLCIVMEYLKGETLASLFRRASARQVVLPRELCSYIVAEAAAGLHAAHELVDQSNTPVGLVHRDVSPQNVFVCYDGSIKLLDFGVAKARDRVTQTQTGQLKGSYAYMSPEQCRAETLDRRSDLFSLGVIFYELTTGHRLFNRSNHLLTLKAVVDGSITPPRAITPDYPERLEAIALKALERDRTRRYQTANELRRDLLGTLADCEATGVPEERLSQLMRDLFADRMEEKEALLNTLRDGATLARLPPPETDLATVIPTVKEPLPGLDAAPTELSPGRPRRPRRSRAIAILLLSGLLGAVILVAAISVTSSSRTGTEARSVGPEPRARVARPGDGRSAAPGPVVLHIDSVPAGAEIWVDDVLRGASPADLEVPRSSTSIELTLQRDGYVPVRMRLVPEAEQRLELKLVADTAMVFEEPADSGVEPDAADRDGAAIEVVGKRWKRRWWRPRRAPQKDAGETGTKYRRFD